VVIERLLFRRFYKADPTLSLLLTFGLAMVAEQALRMTVRRAAAVVVDPAELRGQVFIGDFVYPRYRLLIWRWRSPAWPRSGSCCSARHSAAWYELACRTPTWSARSASRLNPYMAAIAFLGIGLAGLAGVMLAPIFTVHPAMGAEIITSAFVVVVIGGLGSFWGVVLAALVVGLTKGVVTAAGYPQYSEAAIYLLMLLVLLLRPRGLFGERILRFE
jgi:branched-chain amino acid transport system permease protein